MRNRCYSRFARSIHTTERSTSLRSMPEPLGVCACGTGQYLFSLTNFGLWRKTVCRGCGNVITVAAAYLDFLIWARNVNHPDYDMFIHPHSRHSHSSS